MKAEILDVFIGGAEEIDPEERMALSTDKKNPAEIEKIDFIQQNYAHLMAEVEESSDPSDGSFYWALFGFFVNGTEVKYVSNWVPNDQKARKLMYAFEIPAKYLKVGKTLAIQVKTGASKVFWRRDIPRQYTDKSEVFYLRMTDEKGAYA